MVTPYSADSRKVLELIRESGLTIYDPIDPFSPLFFDIAVLEEHLRTELVGLSLDYALRTRAKHSKSYVAEAMGYPVPKSFRKTQPRFPGQNLDVYVQKANNLQIWNEEVDPLRRYVFIRIDDQSNVTNVRVVTGEAIALLDTTGTLTQKYQASRRFHYTGAHLAAPNDTQHFQSILQPTDQARIGSQVSPISRPEPGMTLPISQLFKRLKPILGKQLAYGRIDHERNRGAGLHRLVCEQLGYASYADTGQFPDILNQVLEVKLQTSPTIDLGLVSPDSEAPAQEVGGGIRHCDVRYAVFYASRFGEYDLVFDALVVVTGEEFFREFRRFEGKVTNKKLQIPLPADFFLHPKG